ncbi:MAG: VWA domain-containing protein [Phycisphaerales bacterium]|jgi:hypothetical protein|nr:VWA domain-containing protein [Phycisphaerales bacterium]
MTWVTPSVGLIFGAITLPLLLLLYFLRLRRKSLRVSSTMLWESAVEDLHANTPFQRLRPSMLLLLQLVALLLVILALMQPQLEGGSQEGGKHVIMIDCSGSMSTDDGEEGTRLEDAKKQAVDLINQIHGGGLFSASGGETMVIAFSDRAEIVSPFTDSQQQLRSAIESIQQTHGPSSIEESLKLARAYTTNVDPESEGIAASESAQLELFSDGNISDIATQALQKGETLRYHSVGDPNSINAGIIAFDARRPTNSTDEVQVFLSLLNTSDVEITTDVEVLVDGIPIGSQEVSIPSQIDGEVGMTSVVFVPFSMPNSGVVQAVLRSNDPLEMDNISSLVIPPPKELKVLLSEDGSELVRTVLEGMPLAALRVVSPEVLQSMIDSGESSSYDVVVTRDVPLKQINHGRYLIFGEPPPIEEFSTFVEGGGQVMLVAKEEHPVMRFVRYEEIIVTKGFEIVNENQVETLLEGSGWPAVMSYRGNGVQLIYAAFDPMDSNWPYLRSFPFFIFNSVQYLGRSGDVLTSSTKQVGQSITTNAPDIETIQIEDPKINLHDVSPDSHGNVVWGPIRLSGLHRIYLDEQLQKIVAVNTPIEESDISVAEVISIGATKVGTSSSSRTSFIQLWPWALGVVLLVLLVEWWIYQKKVGGVSRFLSTVSFGSNKS